MCRYLRNIMVGKSVWVHLSREVKGMISDKRQKRLPRPPSHAMLSFKKLRNEVSLIVLIYINNRCFIK